MQGQPAAARSRFEEAYCVIAQTGRGRHNDLAQVRVGLATVELAEGNLPKARDFFLQALCSRGRTAVDTMRALAGMAETLAKDGDLAQAVAVLTLVAGHRFTDHATRKAVQGRLDEMEREVAPSEFDAWRQAGGGLSLDGTVASLIRNEHTL